MDRKAKKQQIIIRRSNRYRLLNFLKGARFGAFLLICSTILEGFYAYTLFTLTGQHTFEALTFIISLIYAALITGVIVFFALRNNQMIVWFAVIFEFSMNALLDIQTVALVKPENWMWIFISQLAIGTILPLATKAFADEVSKKEVSRRSRQTQKPKKNEKRTTGKTQRKRTVANKKSG